MIPIPTYASVMMQPPGIVNFLLILSGMERKPKRGRRSMTTSSPFFPCAVLLLALVLDAPAGSNERRCACCDGASDRRMVSAIWRLLLQDIYCQWGWNFVQRIVNTRYSRATFQLPTSRYRILLLCHIIKIVDWLLLRTSINFFKIMMWHDFEFWQCGFSFGGFWCRVVRTVYL